MNRKTFLILSALAVAALVAAVVISMARQPASEADASRQYLVPGLRDRLNDVTRVSVTGAGDVPVAVAERSGDGWRLANKGGYPADTGKLRRYLLQLADARMLEPKTALAERYVDLGLEDVAGAQAKGLRVELEGLEAPVRLVIGQGGPRGGGTYVRREGEGQTWLVSGDLRPGGGPSRFDMGGGAMGYAGAGTGGDGANAWLDRSLLDIDANQIAAVQLQRDGETVQLVRQADGEGGGGFALQDVPRGREPADAWALSGPGGWLAGLSFDDVLPAADAAPAQDVSPLRARYVTVDGMAVDVEAWEGTDARHYARLQVSRNLAQAKGQDEAGPAAAASDLDTRIAGLTARLHDWVFVLPAYKYEALDKGREDFLKAR